MTQTLAPLERIHALLRVFDYLCPDDLDTYLCLQCVRPSSYQSLPILGASSARTLHASALLSDYLDFQLDCIIEASSPRDIVLSCARRTAACPRDYAHGDRVA